MPDRAMGPTTPDDAATDERPAPFFRYLDRPTVGGDADPRAFGPTAPAPASWPPPAGGWPQPDRSTRGGRSPSGGTPPSRPGPWPPPTGDAARGPTDGWRPVAPRDGRAMAAAVCGVVGLLLSPFLIGAPLAIAATVLGVLGLRRARRRGERPAPPTMVGLGTGVAGVIVSAVVVAVLVTQYGTQLRDYVTCVRSADTAAQQAACRDQLGRSLPSG